MLYGVDAFGPGLLVSAAAIVVLCAVFACWLTARSASRLDPMTALRSE
jgi:ABC-type antimicrobial peptide transport system permease subunit